VSEPAVADVVIDERIPSGLGGRWYGVVTALVKDIRDPMGLGRVKVSLPWLGENEYEAWARVATLMAGKNRGSWFIPDVDDEVLIAFEHGDPRRPYVLGALWNGSDTPGDDLVKKDGSFALRSDHQVGVNAAEAMTLHTDADLTVTAGGGHSQKADGDASIEGQNVTVKAGSSLTIEATGDLTIKGASITVQANGAVQVSGTSISLG
jgi:uncharacterized protein involved in type VI secretion and phage assembly